MSNIAEKYSELKEELNLKDPLFRYQKLKDELDQKDPLVRYEAVKKEIKEIKLQKEKKTLESLENLFHVLGGKEELVSESEPTITKDAEKQPEIVVEKPIRDAEKNNIEEEPIVKEEKLKEYTDTISKLEDVKEKTITEEIDPISARIEKLEKHIQQIALAGPGSGEVRVLNMDDVDTTDLANNKILKYNSSTGKFVFADASGASSVTASRALVSDGTGATAASDVTASELSLLDGGTSATSTSVADGDRVILNDNGTMVQVAVTDLAAYFDDEITAMPNLATTAATTVGALNSGSITSGFGSIDNGSSAITTTGTITYGTLNDGSTDLTATVSTLNKAATTGKAIAMSIVFGS